METTGFTKQTERNNHSAASDSDRFLKHIDQSRQNTREFILQDDSRTELGIIVHELEVLRRALWGCIYVEPSNSIEGSARTCVQRLDRRLADLRQLKRDGNSSPGIEELTDMYSRIQKPLLKVALDPDDVRDTADIEKSLKLVEKWLKPMRARSTECARVAWSQMSNVDLRVDVPQLVEVHKIGIASRTIDFKVNVRVDKIYRMDRRRVDALLDNVLLNSTRAMTSSFEKRDGPIGQIQVTVAEVRRDWHKYLEFKIDDTGPGMQVDDHEQVVLGGSTNSDPGYRHGLKIVERVAASYMGYVSVKTARDVGSEVKVGLNLGLIPELRR